MLSKTKFIVTLALVSLALLQVIPAEAKSHISRAVEPALAEVYFSCGSGYEMVETYQLEDRLGQVFLARVTWHKSLLPGVVVSPDRLAFKIQLEDEFDHFYVAANGTPRWDVKPWSSKTAASLYSGGTDSFKRYMDSKKSWFASLNKHFEALLIQVRSITSEATCRTNHPIVTPVKLR